jgi:prophage antirepressor-like protein
MTVELFQHPDFGSLTTFKDNEGREYFKAHDVCVALRLSNPSQQLKRHVKDKWIFKFDDGYSNSNEALYLSEAGFNALIFRSKTPQAEKYQDWVFETVLPKIRASRYYITSNATSSDLEAIQVEVAALIAEKEKVQAELTMYRRDLDETYAETREALESQRKTEDWLYMQRDWFFTETTPYEVLNRLVEDESIPWRVSRLIKDYMAEKLDIYEEEENNSDVYIDEKADEWLKELIILFLYQTGEHGDMGRFYSFYRGYSRNINPDHNVEVLEMLESSVWFTLSNRRTEESFDNCELAKEMYYTEYMEPHESELNKEHLKKYKLSPTWNYIIPLKLH